jgi:hypothetical protein
MIFSALISSTVRRYLSIATGVDAKKFKKSDSDGGRTGDRTLDLSRVKKSRAQVWLLGSCGVQIGRIASVGAMFGAETQLIELSIRKALDPQPDRYERH